ncbi:hypothetical protein [Chromatium okenii]|jgi:hypothetical protein|uniref:hypothetical protein n=1 Tax=Chromatium okenii TaxID=61644 RepID=UPI0026F3381E|nr:hypothetical protein [Chromatium okenii]MBV5309818.1 hypothetical protein [Chromatium okenii]
MNKVLFAAAAVFFVGSPFAACSDEEEKHCFYYQEDRLVSQSLCTVVECSNVLGGIQEWKWKNGNIVNVTVENEKTLVNGKSAFFFEESNMSCYGIGKNKTEVVCYK